jgi:hypothetical protein
MPKTRHGSGDAGLPLLSRWLLIARPTPERAAGRSDASDISNLLSARRDDFLISKGWNTRGLDLVVTFGAHGGGCRGQHGRPPQGPWLRHR